VEELVWGQLNSSSHAISVSVMPQWTLEHHVCTYDSFVKKKSGESIIETQQAPSLPFHGNITS
jgi:hypothetical protein